MSARGVTPAMASLVKIPVSWRARPPTVCHPGRRGLRSYLPPTPVCSHFGAFELDKDDSLLRTRENSPARR